MTHQDPPIVIIGSGQAGVSLARELRKKSADEPITMITQDAGGFYSKPTLSNAFVKKTPLERLKMQDATTLAEKTNITILPHTQVTIINTLAKTLTATPIDNTNKAPITIHYNKLILAIGGTPYNPPILGIEYTLNINHLDDYLILRQKLKALSSNKRPPRIAIIGGGLVGSELANDLHLSGASITLFERENQLLPRIASPAVSNQLLAAFQKAGIQCFLSSHVNAIKHTNLGTKTTDNLYAVSYRAGDQEKLKTIEADLVISAVGLKPNTELADRIGLNTNRGIQCNRTLQTSSEHIYAIGDCVEIEGLVLPYILPIMEAARALANTLTSQTTEIQYPCMPIAVKTTNYPLVVCPPRVIDQHTYTQNNIEDNSIKTLYYKKDQLIGFSLGGTATQERQSLAAQTLGLLEQ